MQTEYMSFKAICAFLIAIPIAMSGCNSPQLRPQRPFELSKVEATLDTDFDELLKAYYEASAGSDERKSKRNELLDRAVLVTDIKYYEFVESFSTFKKRKDTTSEIGIAALSGTAAVIEPLGTSQILSAIAGGVSTSNIAFNKNYFYEQTTQALISSMDARRLQVRAEITARAALDESVYSLQAALADIERYYNAGTFEGALSAIVANAGELKSEAESAFQARYEQNLNELRARSQRSTQLRNRSYDQPSHDKLHELMTDLSDKFSDEVINDILPYVAFDRRPGGKGDPTKEFSQEEYEGFGGVVADPSATIDRDKFYETISEFSLRNRDIVAEVIVQFEQVVTPNP